MSIINQVLKGDLTLSREEIDAAADVVTPEAAEAVVDELSVVEDPLEEATQASADESEADLAEADEFNDEAEAVDEVQDAVASMEALIERGNVTGLEFAMLDSYLNRAYATLNLAPVNFSAEGLTDSLVRDQELAIALEGAKEVVEKVKEKFNEMKDKAKAFYAKAKSKLEVLFNQHLRRSAALRKKIKKLDAAPKRAEIPVKGAQAFYGIEGGPVEGMKRISAAADYFTDTRMKEIAEFTSGKFKTPPKIDNSLFAKLPGKPQFEFKRGLRVTYGGVDKREVTMKTLTPAEMLSVLDAAENAARKIKYVGINGLSSFLKVAIFIPFVSNLAYFSSSFYSVISVDRFFATLLAWVGNGLSLVKRHLAAY